MQITVVIGHSIRLGGSIVIHLIKVEGTPLEKSKERARPLTPKRAPGLVGPSSAWCGPRDPEGDLCQNLFEWKPSSPIALVGTAFSGSTTQKQRLTSSSCTLATKDQNSELRAHNGQAHARTIGQ
jgi:hypothetical protein